MSVKNRLPNLDCQSDHQCHYYKYKPQSLIENTRYKMYFLCFWRDSPLSGPGPPHSRVFQITHNEAPQSVALPCTSDQLVAGTSTDNTQNSQQTKRPCYRWDSNPQPQQASGRRPTPQAGKLYYDRSITIYRAIHSNRPDMAINCKIIKEAYLIDAAIPNSHNPYRLDRRLYKNMATEDGLHNITVLSTTGNIPN